MAVRPPPKAGGNFPHPVFGDVFYLCHWLSFQAMSISPKQGRALSRINLSLR
jgi:hypothetical protein